MPSLYQNAAILAAVVLVYGAVAGRVSRSWLSGPLLFTAAGMALGPGGAGVISLPITAEGLRLLAEIALAMVLFTDAARADIAVLRGAIRLPERLLLVGLPLTILLGFVTGIVFFPGIALAEVALLAALLAPTDAALGAPVVTNPRVPATLREALNVESGLNDGICVPAVVLLLDLARGIQLEGSALGHIVLVVAEEIGIGLLVGIAATVAAVGLLRGAARLGWTSPHWLHVPVVALAGLCFAAAQTLGGSGFIACFAGGLIFGLLQGKRGHEMLGGAAATGEVLALLTWVVFGGPVLARLLGQVTWAIAGYAVLSLTVIRILPVLLALAGSGMSLSRKLFVGWFGPRGLASIVFAVIVVDAGLPGRHTVATAAAFTVLLSVILHGITATPLVAALGREGEAAAANPGSGG